MVIKGNGLEKEIDDIVAPLPQANPNKWLIIAVTALGTIVVGGLAFGISWYLTDVPAQNAPAVTTASSNAGDLKIKGNRGSKIYHLRGCPNYDDIAERNIVWFKTHEEAKAAGFRMAKNCP